MKKLILVGGLLFGGSLYAGEVCNFSITTLYFGTADLTGPGPFDTTSTLISTCTDGPTGGGKEIRICVHLEEGSGGAIGPGGDPRRMLEDGGSTLLDYNIYSDAGHSTVWGSGFDALPTNAVTIDMPLDVNGAGQVVTTLYGRVNAGQTGLPIGVYRSSFTGSDVQIGHKESTKACSDTGEFAPYASAPFETFVNFGGQCTVRTQPLNFGLMVVGAPTYGSAEIAITCPNTIPYQIALDNGLYYMAPDRRVKRPGSGSSLYINYELYRESARTNRWGETLDTDTVAATGTGASVPHTVFGTVPSGQTIEGGLPYEDTITATVYF